MAAADFREIGPGAVRADHLHRDVAAERELEPRRSRPGFDFACSRVTQSAPTRRRRAAG
jgi:hypothetical protein